MRSTAAKTLPVDYLPVVLVGFLSAFISRSTVLSPAAVGSLLGLAPTVAALLVYYVVWSAAAFALLFALLRRHSLTLQDLGWTGGLSLEKLGAAVAATLAAIMLWPPVEALLRWLAVPLYWDPSRRGFVEPASAVDIFALLVLGALLVPPLEETLFRGYLLRVLVERTGMLPGVLLHNLVFAGVHSSYGPGLMAYIFLWSFLPAWLYLRYRSVYPSMLMHSLNNVFADIPVPLLLT